MEPRRPTQAAAQATAGRAGAGGYSTREAASLVGLAPDRIRRFVRRGLLAPRRTPGGEYRFSFQDMVLLRTAKSLLDAHVSSRRAIAALTRLQSRLAAQSDGQPLSAMRIFADGNTVLVQDDDALWDAETGQGQLAITVQRLAGEVRTLARRNLAARQAGVLDSDAWYNLGLDLEEVEPDKASDAYRRAIALDPANADAHVNLGRLHQVRGDLERAKRHYQQALDAVSDHPLAIYNLGTVYDELGELEVAVGYYQRAEEVPDAHYNLARVFELRGDELAFPASHASLPGTAGDEGQAGRPALGACVIGRQETG